MRATGLHRDGRWWAIGLLLAYYAVLGLAGPGEGRVARWRTAGVYAHPAPFVDLQVFPAARATVAGGGALYGPSVTDPMQRPYNYPRVWLAFMRFPADVTWFRALGCLLAAAAIAAVLVFWGRLSAGEGVWGGLLLCSPAFQLGIERGNTDLAMLVLVAAGVWLAAEKQRARLAASLWCVAAVLKLFPILALGAWFDGSVRAWLRRAWLPLVLFTAYLALTWGDLAPVLRNTGGGWVQSYGSEVLAATWSQVQAFYGSGQTGSVAFGGVGRCVAAAGVMLMFLWGRFGGASAWAPTAETSAAERRALFGFRVGTLVYVATFLAGSSFDYRQCFLLLALPQLWAWWRARQRLAAVALLAMLFSFAANYVLAGWPGFFLNETGGWLQLFVLSALLGGTWRRGMVAIAP
jgi:hypothetical protein